MAKHQKASVTRKSHKSRKTDTTEPVKPETSLVPVTGPSSREPATAEPNVPPNDIANILLEKPGKDMPVAPVGSEGVTLLPYKEVEAKKEWWYRPPDSKTRKVVAKILVLDAAGHKDAAIAKKLKTTVGTIQQARYVAKKNGWLRENEAGEDELIDLEAELSLTVDRKIVRNINASLDGQMTNWQTHETTLAAAKGRGIFKSHEVSKNDGAQTLPVVAIQVIMPTIGAEDQLPTITESDMGGVPAYVEGEIEEGPEADGGAHGVPALDAAHAGEGAADSGAPDIH